MLSLQSARMRSYVFHSNIFFKFSHCLASVFVCSPIHVGTDPGFWGSEIRSLVTELPHCNLWICPCCFKFQYKPSDCFFFSAEGM